MRIVYLWFKYLLPTTCIEAEGNLGVLSSKIILLLLLVGVFFFRIFLLFSGIHDIFGDDLVELNSCRTLFKPEADLDAVNTIIIT